ncbi:MAG: spore coat protein CotJB [Bacilli bacterium]|nr:spore coat protein CotJB [Bacilli bacterium]MDD4282764.1 spore coat protein CotJB [Bacilli bacterium]MDD4718378.1 spore coat protein CotJB [Bacilli bacterium]
MNNYQHYPNSNYYKNFNAQNVNSNQDLFDPYTGFIHGNMFPKTYDPYKLSKPYEIKPLNEQAQLLTQIDALKFAMIDLGLYLDVHPDDQNMLNTFNQYRVQANELKMEYDSKYGPLLLSNDSLTAFPWAWNDRPWPWENK